MFATLVTAAVCLAAASCSAGPAAAGHGTEPASTPEITSEASSTTASHQTTRSASGRSTAQAATSSSSTVAETRVPGGLADMGILRQAGWLTADRKIDLNGSGARAAARGELPGSVSGELCTLLFGTPREVTTFAGLAPGSMLVETSGWYPASDPTEESVRGMIACLYGSDDGTVLMLVVSDGAPATADSLPTPLTVADRGIEGIVSYFPGYDGPQLPNTIGSQWLHHAVAQVATPGEQDP